MESPNGWTRHAYPVQSSKTEPCTTPLPQENLASTIQFPTRIHAVQEAEKFQPHGKTIVVCLDGTGDKFDGDNSNIVYLVSCLKKDDKFQNTYYQAGIGTYSNNGVSSGISASLDMAVGSLLGLHVRDAYHFLMQTYKEGDKICIFGFSRGAYTARCLAGMIHKIGLLAPHNVAQIPFAYDIYKDDSNQGREQSIQFKRTFCTNVSVYLLGLFDSVASVGIIPRDLPFSTTSTARCNYIRHAVALDERRAKFKVCRFEGSDYVPPAEEPRSGTAAPAVENKVVEQSDGYAHRHSLSNGEIVTPDKINRMKRSLSEPSGSVQERRPKSRQMVLKTDLLEIWFAGCHADIGGGAVKNEERHRLAQIPLRWMIRQCFECDTGIIFKAKMLVEMGIDVHTLWPKYIKLEAPILGPSPSLVEQYQSGLPPRSRRSSLLTPIKGPMKKRGYFDLSLTSPSSFDWLPEQIEDYFDALSPMNDQLTVAMAWWMLEVFPTGYQMYNPKTNVWDSRIGMNLGMPRPVIGAEPNLHWTVQHRMTNLGYKPKALMEKGAVWQIMA
ncbi:hypothetical protein LTR84_009590 [Exophiala bonariae]|uniref:T6SS Phospholipase effector Tle1-like catalytic domain-containing protein n=1 Tax=Exophiala bonariae TaxID=1690606 RepID=A0AAV9NIP8_9EURO|nr:hypothetical protein LTR84_009590 [Exophiala bonariae]